MKFLAFILSIYILSLNFVACADSVPVDPNLKIEISQPSDSHPLHADLDLCSPFCQCHCCHINADYLASTQSEILIPQIPTKVYLHFDSLGNEFPETILQPPRV